MAEYCFIRAELGARSITTDDAATCTTMGFTASIQFYDARATDAKIAGYTAVAASAITAYLGQSGVLFDATKAVSRSPASLPGLLRSAFRSMGLVEKNGFPQHHFHPQVEMWSGMPGAASVIVAPLPSSSTMAGRKWCWGNPFFSTRPMLRKADGRSPGKPGRRSAPRPWWHRENT